MRRCRVVGKVQYHSLEQAAGAARYSARVANARRELSQTMYAYRCGWCRKIHVTRDPAHEELTNVVVFVAPPEALQRWAFPPAPSVPH